MLGPPSPPLAFRQPFSCGHGSFLSVAGLNLKIIKLPECERQCGFNRINLLLDGFDAVENGRRCVRQNRQMMRERVRHNAGGCVCALFLTASVKSARNLAPECKLEKSNWLKKTRLIINVSQNANAGII